MEKDEALISLVLRDKEVNMGYSAGVKREIKALERQHLKGARLFKRKREQRV